MENSLEWRGFEITELAPSDGQTKGTQLDFEIAGISRINNFKFSCSLTSNITQYGELVGSSKLTQMKDDYTANSHYITYTFLRGWENVLFELGSERVKRLGECTF